jgi:hypothetical protein
MCSGNYLDSVDSHHLPFLLQIRTTDTPCILTPVRSPLQEQSTSSAPKGASNGQASRDEDVGDSVLEANKQIIMTIYYYMSNVHNKFCVML